MTTRVILKGNSNVDIFGIDGSLPLNIGDIFKYKAAEPSEHTIEKATFQIKHFENSEWDRYKAKDIERKMKNSLSQFEKWGEGVRLIVVDKEVSVYRNSNFLQEDVLSTFVYLYVEIYDEAYIRDKKLEQII